MVSRKCLRLGFRNRCIAGPMYSYNILHVYKYLLLHSVNGSFFSLLYYAYTVELWNVFHYYNVFPSFRYRNSDGSVYIVYFSQAKRKRGWRGGCCMCACGKCDVSEYLIARSGVSCGGGGDRRYVKCIHRLMHARQINEIW